ncbi:hypothetical protein EXS65_01940 [Candidatus Peribacteria bacterium]|nr:hypothetical protein [Candidatus Peribacteria bacterium]
MNATLRRYWPTALLALALATIVAMNIRPYGWNITAVFHMDHVIHDAHAMPKDFVVLGVPAYDGAQYYQIARNIPIVFQPSKWNELRNTSPVSYAYQRFLLPLAAYMLSLGQEETLPWAFVLINIAALLLTATVVLRWNKGHPLTALALALSPTAMVAIHFTLAEPLTLLLITVSLLRIDKTKKIDAVTIALLSLLVWAREVNILFILFLIGYFLFKKHWRHAIVLLIPVGSFLLLHSLIYAIFGDIPFLISTGAHQFPGQAAYDVLVGHRGYDRYTLSSVALLLGFVLPALLWTGREILKTRSLDLLPFGAFAFLCLMLIMPDYIWGSITSIGRVITPVYPLTLLALCKHRTFSAKLLTLSILLLGIGTGIGLMLQIHPFTLA